MYKNSFISEELIVVKTEFFLNFVLINVLMPQYDILCKTHRNIISLYLFLRNGIANIAGQSWANEAYTNLLFELI